MAYAVIRTGGKQYRVAPGDVVRIERLAGEVGAPVEFTEVLLTGGEGAVRIGTPLIDGARVRGTIVEQRPRAQSRGEAIVLERGDAVIFPNRFRPVAGTRGSYRVTVRHGVSRVHSGERVSLGIIFHDAA